MVKKQEKQEEKAEKAAEKPKKEAKEAKESQAAPAAAKQAEISVSAPIVCISCKKRITNDPGSVKFMCPSCGNFEIIRCRHCRQIVAKYTCPACGFVGPN